tara:strand:+ start:295 stop:489 length:195 start_codon:yes stop_codon:yes gene_type:complete
MFDRDEYTGMFIGFVCVVSFIGICWITFPMAAEKDKSGMYGADVLTLPHYNFEIDGVVYNCNER